MTRITGYNTNVRSCVTFFVMLPMLRDSASFFKKDSLRVVDLTSGNDNSKGYVNVCISMD